MHLLIPFASALSQEALQVLPSLALPNLTRLLGRLAPAERDEADEYTLSPPHERALASAWGWRGADGALPFAARAAAADGIAVEGRAWGLVTPVHWHVGRDHITMADPELLRLDAAESRALFEAVRELFEGEGFEWAWGAPQRWYAAHPHLARLPCASLDRVIGRNVDFWLDAGSRADSNAALIRRLQSEVQLLLYPHPINEAREARGELALNSFWLSGCGAAQPVDEDAVAIDASLRTPLLAGDAAAWSKSWSALDAGAIGALLREVAAADRDVALTLCGERTAQRWHRAPRTLRQRLGLGPRAPHVGELLASL
ncbi:MAG: hypothetical protein ABI809_00970 [Caldimonas sp.]